MLTKFIPHFLKIKTVKPNEYGEDIITYVDGGVFDGWITYTNHSQIENQGLDVLDITHEGLVRAKVPFHIGDMIDDVYEIKFIQDDWCRRYTKLYLTEIRSEKKLPTEVYKFSDYLYKVVYNELPQTQPTNFNLGGCSSFVENGKLYRNLDWDYNEDLSFIVECSDFTGMAFGGIDDIPTLPYRVVDGVNKNGIMVATHILYNDWEWNGSGNIPLYKIPFIALSTMEKIDDINNLPLDNLCKVASLGEYISQYIISDGTTTYAIMPSIEDNTYVIENITSNPKLTNFRWVVDSTVNRTNLQNRPSGVERWNMMPCELSELRFTKAYENSDRLSEFIGIDETTKDSSDEELLEIYNKAHELYIHRERDGKTWQTIHSIVYGANGIEHLYIQEDWGKDYGYNNQ